MTTTASTPSIPSHSRSPEQYLSEALENLIKAYKGIKDNNIKKSWTFDRLYRKYPNRRKPLYKRRRRKGKRCPKRIS